MFWHAMHAADSAQGNACNSRGHVYKRLSLMPHVATCKLWDHVVIRGMGCDIM